jgi:hypothetical protein
VAVPNGCTLLAGGKLPSFALMPRASCQPTALCMHVCLSGVFPFAPRREGPFGCRTSCGQVGREDFFDWTGGSPSVLFVGQERLVVACPCPCMQLGLCFGLIQRHCIVCPTSAWINAAQAVKGACHRFANGHIADCEERAKKVLAQHQADDPEGCYSWLEPRRCERGHGMTGSVFLILVSHLLLGDCLL